MELLKHMQGTLSKHIARLTATGMGCVTALDKADSVQMELGLIRGALLMRSISEADARLLASDLMLRWIRTMSEDFPSRLPAHPKPGP
jgi:hypothetical protein